MSTLGILRKVLSNEDLTTLICGREQVLVSDPVAIEAIPWNGMPTEELSSGSEPSHPLRQELYQQTFLDFLKSNM
jgi:hypothetical protein